MNTEKTWTGERLEPGIFNETAIEHLHRYAFALDYVKNKKVLDMACGEGYGTALLAKQALQVTGVDIDGDTIEKAKNTYRQHNIEFIKGDVTKVPSPDHVYDMVVCFETLEHLAEHDQLLAEIKRVLIPGGLLLVSTPDKINYTEKTNRKNPFHVKELTTGEFSGLLKKYFRQVKILHQQIAFSSVITGDEAEGFTSYTGDFNEVHAERNENSLYNIALASDEDLPVLKNSLFNGRSVFADAVTEKENQVINTFTYKLGHALLYPAKLIRKFINKK